MALPLIVWLALGDSLGVVVIDGELVAVSLLVCEPLGVADPDGVVL